MPSQNTGYDIAVIGVAGRFPGARNVGQFWRNLRAGVESVTIFTDDELLAAGESPELLRDPNYVKAQPVLDDFDRFDAGFFSFSPQDASVMDPQHRVFLEVGWEALEDAGHEAESFPGNIGVFATCGMNTYMMYNLVHNRRIMDNVGEWLVRHTGNDMNFLATRLSYELNLKGPSMNVQTACSSALVAIHLASLSLFSGECDMALAGGCTIALPQKRGYVYKPNEILSPDGHCRPFDAQARGTLFGSGAGVVVLRRLADAQDDRDRILAVVKGSAINNDGSNKVGYLAPSVEGQSKAIVEALTVSGVNPDTISCLEAHGTGTIVGDPIEVVALTQAYRQFTDKTGFCALGSLKSNIGHLGEAAGVAAFIKVVLALKHKEIPASLHYESPNPQIDFANSPLYVNAKLTPWPAATEPRRAGITSLGAGGTNCHVIVEEVPEAPVSGSSRPCQLLLLSAGSGAALDTATANLAAHLAEQQDANLADVAFTLHVGRKAFAHRRALVCRTREEAVAACQSKEGLIAGSVKGGERTVAFLFPGQGSQHLNMGRGLYDAEPVFRAEVDRGAEILKQARGMDLLAVLFSKAPTDEMGLQLNQTALAQPALFLIEYALAKLWMHWGVQPRAMLGHSIGEYVAACLAGVFSLADAITLVADRGQFMQQAPRGSMLAVSLSGQEVQSLLASLGMSSQLCLSVVNGPKQSVVGGPDDAISALENELTSRGIQGQRLQTSHAFHSAMMEPILTPFAERVRRVTLRPPAIPYLSNLTGTWVRAEEATDPEYWVRHLRHTVRFSDCLSTLLNDTDQVLLEVGPGRTLAALARQQPIQPAAVVPSLGLSGDESRDQKMLLRACGNLWVHGCKVDAARLYDGQRRCRVSLPTYPFEHRRYWIDPDTPVVATAGVPTIAESLEKKPDLADWFYLPTWQRALLPEPAQARVPDVAPDWLVFLDECGLGNDLIEKLQSAPVESNAAAVQLAITVPGDLDNLAIQRADRQEPAADDVEIRVLATALNFADVLKASGAFPEAPFGMECAGIIERVGRAVSDFKVGDQVVAIGPDSFRSYVTRHARFVARKPDHQSMEEAVTLPAAFMTAWHALHNIGKLQSGEKVLVHAASGGVGLAAVQLARAAGAEVFATAGSKEKRAFLESIGIPHVFDSRTLRFAEEILAQTGGAGVNVVLNSLTGEFIPKSLSALADGGRFLEIGKREIYSPAQLAALPSRPGVSYHPIDLTQVLRGDPVAYGKLLRTVIDLAHRRHIEALPKHVFAFTEAVRAFSLMLQTRHIGKVVLSMGGTPPTVYRVRAGAGFRQHDKHEFVIHPGHVADYVAMFKVLERASARIGHIVHLANVTSATDGVEPLEKSLAQGFFSLTWLAKAIGSRDWTHPIDLAVITTGLHQLAGESNSQPAKATLLGPCRVIPHEFSKITCRCIDVPATVSGAWPRQRLVQQLLAEISAGLAERMVAYRHADRWVQRFEATPLRPSRSPTLRPGGTYLITGGLGGLGLELAEHLARTVRANLILLGRAPFPADKDWDEWLRTHDEDNTISEKIRRLRACIAAGATVFSASADVTDHDRLHIVVAEARKHFGAIHGVIHAAGTLDDGLIQLKTPESALGVLGPKVQGTLLLDEVLGDEALDFFALFSSVSSVLGLQGQVDYTAANAFLDAFASYRSARRPGQTVAINWSAWQEVGMAARALGKSRGSRPADVTPRHPWLERRHEEGRDIIFATTFSRARHWLLDEHALHGGAAVIPGTGYLEIARAALAEVAETPASEISRVVFQAPFAVADGDAKELVFTLRPAGSGWDFSIQSRSGAVTHVTGHVAPAAVQPPKRIDIAALSASCNTRTEVLTGFLKQSFMDFGPRWGNVREIRFGHDEALLTLELPSDFVSDLASFPLHPALLDMATGGAQPVIHGFDQTKDFYIPFSYGRVILHKALTAKLYSHVKLRTAKTQSLATFDVTIADEAGVVVAEITDFLMKRIAQFTLDSSSHGHSETSKVSSAASLASEFLRQGIAPREGIEAFERILARGVAPQIIVSPVDIHVWIKQADASSEPKPSKPEKPATAMESVAGAPTPSVVTSAGDDSIEQRLRGLYRQLLGVDNIGLLDDFFELGGHSLLAVRLLTRIEKDFQSAISLAELFQAPTIEQLAAILRGTAAPKRKEFKVIVPFNDQGRGPAFYCVHSVGGEVASFRHLARILGPEKRFYGIQVPPEMHNAEFASSIESMARYYLQALLDFQPEGPYVLGGWSAGSVIALEMAQQLIAGGRQVELVVALDGAPFNTQSETSLWNPLYYAKVVRNLPNWLADDLLLSFSFSVFARRVWNKVASLTKAVLGPLRGIGKPQPEVSSFMDTSYYSPTQRGFMDALYHALLKYVAAPYSGQVLLYQARTQPLYHLLEVDRSWKKIAAHVDLVVVPGTHVSIVLEPYIETIAEDLRERLARLSAEAR